MTRRKDKWHEPAMRLFDAYWGLDGSNARSDSWKDDQSFARRLDEMCDEMEATGFKRFVSIDNLRYIAEKIRGRA